MNLVFFHAHPDDESISTGGSIARAVAEGHDVAIVFATRGECGQVPDGHLDDGETLGERRTVEVAASAAALGVDAVYFLDYRDSGMEGTATNEDPRCFWQADRDEASERLAGILRARTCDVLTVYDDHGGYGHPDHIQVHRVGVRAAELAGVPRVYEATMNRDHIRRMMDSAREMGVEADDAPDVAESESFGSPEEIITTTVDVRDFVEAKRASMRAHASQIQPTDFFMQMPDEAFGEVFGWEFFIRRGVEPTHEENWLVDPVSGEPG